MGLVQAREGQLVFFEENKIRLCLEEESLSQRRPLGSLEKQWVFFDPDNVQGRPLLAREDHLDLFYP